jgi:succinate dehydrogenase / fumarate reductase cytochrome b subunit
MLSVGLVFFVYIISSVSDGATTYAEMQGVMSSWLIRPMYWGFVYALFFHLCHGVRHLIWDAGETFEKETLDRYAIIELCVSLALTLLILIFI